jgi:hypothetical protein
MPTHAARARNERSCTADAAAPAAQIINSYLPAGQVTLATCVQNKAVDAIAEKLAAAALPFFVFGNDARLSLLAKEWTLQAQVDRDPRVVAAAARLERVRALSSMFRNKLYTAVSGRFNATHARYRQARADAKFGRAPSEKKEAWLTRDLWATWWRSYALHVRHPLLALGMLHADARTGALSRHLQETAARVFAEKVDAARAVLCTVATASRSLLSDEDVKPAVARIATAVLDEAGTCPETKLPLLLLLPQLERVIAIGDQKQLQPFSHWKAPRGGGGGGGGGGRGICHYYNGRPGSCRRGTACSFAHGGGRGSGISPMRTTAADASSGSCGAEPTGFFQRIEQALPAGAVPSLQEQYRMHPAICGFISATFYGGSLRTPAAVCDERERADARGLWWLDCGARDAETQRAGATSYSNPEEVQAALDVVLELGCQPASAAKSVLVITFYRGQDVALRRAMEHSGLLERASAGSDGGSLRVLTVDQAQGSEADVVVLSCVRSNASRSIGFVSNANRMNVAVSRARERLVVIGDAATLCGDAKWSALRARCRVVASADELPPMRATGGAADDTARSLTAALGGLRM